MNTTAANLNPIKLQENCAPKMGMMFGRVRLCSLIISKNSLCLGGILTLRTFIFSKAAQINCAASFGGFLSSQQGGELVGSLLSLRRGMRKMLTMCAGYNIAEIIKRKESSAA